MVEYRKEFFEDLQVVAETSLFAGKRAECHVMFHVTEPGLPFESQNGRLLEALCQLLALDRYKGFRTIASRMFCSDISNQGASKHAEGAAGRIQQPPLEGRKAVLLAYLAEGLDISYGDGCTLASGNGYSHHFMMNMTSARDGSYEQTSEIIDGYERTLEDMDMSMERNCVRTWFYVRDVDTNYKGLVVSRREKFLKMGMNPSTHYIASTGIGGTPAPTGALVQMDAYSIKGLEPAQLSYLNAPTHLNPTYEYGVTFERGAQIEYGDRKHVFISGTASINNKGEIMYENDIIRQAGRMAENVSALLHEAGASFSDVMYMTVYLRDVADYETVKAYMDEHFPDIPRVITYAPVCRTGWLIEMECMAIAACRSSFRDF